MVKTSRSATQNGRDEALLELLERLVKAIDRLGLNNESPAGVPGTTEAIAMNLKDGLTAIADSNESIARALQQVAEALRGRNADEG